MTDNIFLAGALLVGIVGAGWDIKTNSVPNRLTYPAMLAGVVLHTVVEGWKGILFGSAGLLLGGGIFLVLYFLRTLGAGDVKMLAAVGAFAGPSQIVEIALYSAIAGGFIALIVALFHGRLRKTLGNVASLVRFHVAAGPKVHPSLNLDNPDALRFPYGVAILVGTFVAVVNYVR